MKNILQLPHDYFDQYIAHEQNFRKRYEGTYFSKPVFYEKDGKEIAVAPWGAPGWTNPAVFPYAHYISITNVEAKTWVFHFKDLLNFLKSNYKVTEYDDAIPHIVAELPDFLSHEEEELKFWKALNTVPTVNN